MIVGTPRSGTTLVQRYVTEECGLRSGPESHFFTTLPPMFLRHRRDDDESRALRETLLEYSRIPQLVGSGLDVDRLMESLVPKPVHLFAVFEAVVAQLAGDGDEFAEKTPGHLWWWDRLTRHDPSLKLVVMVRDPRAVVASMRAARFTDLDLTMLGQWWQTDQRMAGAARHRLGSDRCLIVRYEDAVEHEQAVRAQLSAFHARPNTTHDLTRAGVPPLVLPWETWKRGFDKPPTRDRVDAWRSDLTPDEIGTIERVCRREMAAFGYEPTSHPGWTHRLVAPRPLARSRFRVAVAGHRWQQRRIPL